MLPRVAQVASNAASGFMQSLAQGQFASGLFSCTTSRYACSQEATAHPLATTPHAPSISAAGPEVPIIPLVNFNPETGLPTVTFGYIQPGFVTFQSSVNGIPYLNPCLAKYMDELPLDMPTKGWKPDTTYNPPIPVIPADVDRSKIPKCKHIGSRLRHFDDDLGYYLVQVCINLLQRIWKIFYQMWRAKDDKECCACGKGLLGERATSTIPEGRLCTNCSTHIGAAEGYSDMEPAARLLYSRQFAHSCAQFLSEHRHLEAQFLPPSAGKDHCPLCETAFSPSVERHSRTDLWPNLAFCHPCHRRFNNLQNVYVHVEQDITLFTFCMLLLMVLHKVPAQCSRRGCNRAIGTTSASTSASNAGVV
ncbi:hypothetical protein FB45DRAFT_867273 [Roridomyces roridus]|uniref:Uncharacterized protein n=1 Tax=Roridomyces roridus TaxID=1738132 RepID=A0AAD7BUP4_9AGAR|nr:hypothetical protein FB45DRAFT_867273 [Roridomyces roridus]